MITHIHTFEAVTKHQNTKFKILLPNDVSLGWVLSATQPLTLLGTYTRYRNLIVHTTYDGWPPDFESNIPKAYLCPLFDGL